MKKLFYLLITFTFLFSLFLPRELRAHTIRVPEDYSTIKQAVYAATDGDVVEVDDGIYYEKDIEILNNITVRSKNLYGAVVDGSGCTDYFCSIFWIRAEAEIEGFVLRNCNFGIHQRGSPNVSWVAHNLIILNMKNSGIEVNDCCGRIGTVYAYNIVFDKCHIAAHTNDAYGVDIRNCIVTNCSYGFGGYNHFFFNVSYTMVWNCHEVIKTVHEVTLGPGVVELDPLFIDTENGDYHLCLNSPAIDSGDPDPVYNDLYFPPSWRTERNDMGAYGGSGAYEDLSEQEKQELIDRAKCAIEEVEIDIKPGSDPNSINCKNEKGVIPVAIFSTDFDVTSVNPLTVTFVFGGAKEIHEKGHLEDVDSDGDLDIILHFRFKDTGIQCGDTKATIIGETYDGKFIIGTDEIRTVGKD